MSKPNFIVREPIKYEPKAKRFYQHSLQTLIYSHPTFYSLQWFYSGHSVFTHLYFCQVEVLLHCKMLQADK